MRQIFRFDPEGGDLGRGRKVNTLELAVVVPHIADFISWLSYNKSDDMGNLQYSYGFEVHSTEKNLLIIAMLELENKFPRNVKWYETDGIKVFDMRGASGGIVSSLACYLITVL